MRTIVFDVMYGGRFIMQYVYKWCPAFPIDLDEVANEVVAKRPTLKGKRIELYQTETLIK